MMLQMPCLETRLINFYLCSCSRPQVNTCPRGPPLPASGSGEDVGHPRSVRHCKVCQSQPKGHMTRLNANTSRSATCLNLNPQRCSTGNQPVHIHLLIRKIHFNNGRPFSPTASRWCPCRSSPQTSCISVFFSKSKIDLHSKGFTFFVGATGSHLCPVVAVLVYLAIRANTLGPLFLLSSGVTLTRKTFVICLKQRLLSVGIDSSGCNGHSFKIAAMTAARVGIPECTIKILGRWESSAYCLYVRTSRQQVTGISSNLVSVLQPKD